MKKRANAGEAPENKESGFRAAKKNAQQSTARRAVVPTRVAARARVGARAGTPVYKARGACIFVMCRESSAGGTLNTSKGTHTGGYVSVRELAALMQRASETVGAPGALVFGQRKVGEVIWEEDGEQQVLMWPVARGDWPFISDTKPKIVHSDDGLCERWGLDSVHVVRCEHVGCTGASRAAHALRVLRGLVREHGVQCTERGATASSGVGGLCASTLKDAQTSARVLALHPVHA